MGKKSSKKLKPLEIPSKRDLTKKEKTDLFDILEKRFEENMDRHQDITWSNIKNRLEADSEKQWSVYLMEQTGGEPDVVGYDKETDEYIIFDCSQQSPSERRSICYDTKGEQERVKKGIYPSGNAIDGAKDMGITLLTEDQYRDLQKLGEFDTKTSSWVKTPDKIRKLGGAIFCDRRYDTVFTYHNGAQSFYSARGFRGCLRL